MAESKKSKQPPQKEEAAAVEFTKQKIISSKKYQPNRDVLTALLSDGETYTHDKVCEILNKFYEKEVK
jgi:hypothetical protein